MMDLRNALEDVAGRPVAPTIQQVQADLGRGRGALRRRRAIQTAGGSLFAVAAAVAAFAVTTSGTATGPGGTEAKAPPAATAGRISLVAYQGEQPKGFTIDTVPDGWFVESVNKYELVIAPKEGNDAGPAADPSAAPADDRNIFISLQSKDEKAPDGKTTKVDGREMILRKSLRGYSPGKDGMVPEPEKADGDYGSTVFIKQDSGIWVLVQFPGGLGFTEKQKFELSAGVHADSNAVQGVG